MANTIKLNKPKLFLVCTGLGIVQRGFETYIADLGEKLLIENASFSTKVYSGGVYHSTKLNSTKLFCIPRNSVWCNKLFGASATSEIEQISFFFSFIWRVLMNRPSAIYLGEYKLYCYLYKFRKLFQLKFSLMLYTGGQVSPGLFDTQKDYVHHVTDIYYNDLINIGYPPNRQFILPHFISNYTDTSSNEKLKGYNIQGKKVIISVGLIDKSIKKMDRFVKVLMNNPTQYFPIILGESTNDTPEIENMLLQYFGKKNYFIGKVARVEIPQYLKQSDLFMLLSPKESFGLAALEALSVGLPVICCDFHESRQVLNKMAILINCNDIEQIRTSLKYTLDNSNLEAEKQARRNFVRNHYSWGALETKYINMFNRVVLNN